MVKELQIYDGRTSFYQWDLNQKITSNTFKVGDEIHCFNMRQSTALVVIAYELDGKVVADVPNILLQSSCPITVYRYINNNNNARTIEEYLFEVKQRPKPDDYIYTETDVYNIETIIDQALLEAKDVIIEEVLALVNQKSSYIAYIELQSSEWEGKSSPFSQSVSIDGITENSKVDLNPSVEQLTKFYEKDIAFVVENEDGVITVYAIGQKPAEDYTMQVTITEVSTNG